MPALCALESQEAKNTPVSNFNRGNRKVIKLHVLVDIK